MINPSPFPPIATMTDLTYSDKGNITRLCELCPGFWMWRVKCRVLRQQWRRCTLWYKSSGKVNQESSCLVSSWHPESWSFSSAAGERRWSEFETLIYFGNLLCFDDFTILFLLLLCPHWILYFSCIKTMIFIFSNTGWIK